MCITHTIPGVGDYMNSFMQCVVQLAGTQLRAVQQRDGEKRAREELREFLTKYTMYSWLSITTLI